MFWPALDRFLARMRPAREPLSLLLDLAVVAAAWHATYLFRLGFERWFSARPGYDTWVLGGLLLGLRWPPSCCCACPRACGASAASARCSAWRWPAGWPACWAPPRC
jgi:hypothetical protein